MRGRIGRLIVLIVAAAGLALVGAARVDSPLVFLSVPLALYLLVWAPGEALLALLDRPRSLRDPVWSWAAPLALGPVVAGTTAILVNLAGVSWTRAAWSPVALTALLLLLSVVRRPAVAGEHEIGPTSPRDRRALLIFALGLGLLIGLIYLGNPWLRWRADGRFHIGVVEEILRGGLPPTDPFFAGLSLQYMWFFHAFVVALRVLGGASTAVWMALINVVMLAAVALLLWQFGRGVGRPAPAALLGAALVLLAMGGHGWIFLPIKMAGALTGAERGWPALASIFNLKAGGIGQAMSLFGIWMDQSFFLRKFVVGTAMSLNLAVFFLHLEMSRRVLERPRAGLLLLVALTGGGCIVLHPMMGIPAVASTSAATLFLFARNFWSTPDEGVFPGRATAAILGANVLGALFSLPYLRLVTSGKEGVAGFPVDFYFPKIASLVLGTLVVGLVAIPWLWRRLVRGPAGPRAEVWVAAWAVAMTGFAMIVRFPLERENIDKPTLLAHIALALPAGWILSEAMGRGRAGLTRAVRLLLALIIVPINVVILSTYLLTADPRIYRPHEKEAFAFIDRSAPKECVVFDSQDQDRPGVEIQRRMYWSREQFAETHEYPQREVDARRAARDDLYSEDGPGPETVTRLREFGPPIWVIVRAGAALPGTGHPPAWQPGVDSFAAGTHDPLADSAAFERTFDSDDVRVYRLR